MANWSFDNILTRGNDVKNYLLTRVDDNNPNHMELKLFKDRFILEHENYETIHHRLENMSSQLKSAKAQLHDCTFYLARLVRDITREIKRIQTDNPKIPYLKQFFNDGDDLSLRKQSSPTDWRRMANRIRMGFEPVAVQGYPSLDRFSAYEFNTKIERLDAANEVVFAKATEEKTLRRQRESAAYALTRLFQLLRVTLKTTYAHLPIHEIVQEYRLAGLPVNRSNPASTQDPPLSDPFHDGETDGTTPNGEPTNPDPQGDQGQSPDPSTSNPTSEDPSPPSDGQASPTPSEPSTSVDGTPSQTDATPAITEPVASPPDHGAITVRASEREPNPSLDKTWFKSKTTAQGGLA